MKKTTNDYMAVYKAQLAVGDVLIAYERLLKYLLTLKTYFIRELKGRYSCGNVSPGYLDYSYFPVYNDFLRNRRLRFGIILNHRQLRFELWLMGQNAEVQKAYWRLLKNTLWNHGCSVMPKYSVLETVLVDTPDFDDLPALSPKILQSSIAAIEEIMLYLV